LIYNFYWQENIYIGDFHFIGDNKLVIGENPFLLAIRKSSMIFSSKH